MSGPVKVIVPEWLAQRMRAQGLWDGAQHVVRQRIPKTAQPYPWGVKGRYVGEHLNVPIYEDDK